jgi:hypothetical protein
MKTFKQFRNELLENSLYSTPQDKLDFIADNEKIVTAFLYSFIGSLTLYNKDKVKSKQYFVTDKKLQVANVDDTNNDTSLILKIMYDVHGFKNPNTVNDLTRLLAKMKVSDVDIDENFVRGWLSDLSSTLHSAIPSELKKYVDDFVSSKISLERLSYSLYKRKSKYANDEYLSLSKKVGPIPRVHAAHTSSVTTTQPVTSVQTTTIQQPTASPLPQPVANVQPLPIINTVPAAPIVTNQPIDIIEPEDVVDEYKLQQDSVKQMSVEETDRIAKSVVRYIKLEEAGESSKISKKIQADYDLVKNNIPLMKTLISRGLPTTKNNSKTVDLKIFGMMSDEIESSNPTSIDFLLDSLSVVSNTKGYSANPRHLGTVVSKLMNNGVTLQKIIEQHTDVVGGSLTSISDLLFEGILFALCQPKTNLDNVGDHRILEIVFDNKNIIIPTLTTMLSNQVENIESCNNPNIKEIISSYALKNMCETYFCPVKEYNSILSLSKGYSKDKIDELFGKLNIPEYKKEEQKILFYLNSGMPIGDIVSNSSDKDKIKDFLLEFSTGNNNTVNGSTNYLLSDNVRKHIYQTTLDYLPELTDYSFKQSGYYNKRRVTGIIEHFINNINDTVISDMITPKFIERVFDKTLAEKDYVLNGIHTTDIRTNSDITAQTKMGFVNLVSGSLMTHILTQVSNSHTLEADELFKAIKQHAPTKDFLLFMEKNVSSSVGAYLTLKDSPLTIKEKDLKPAQIGNVLAFNDIDLSSIPEFKIDMTADSISDTIKTAMESQKDIIKPLHVKELDTTVEQNKKLTSSIIDSTHAGKHGDVYCKILRQFEVNLPEEGFEEFTKQMKLNGTHNEVIPAFHGTGTIAANMILRYGFKIIPAGDPSVTGRMLGDGVYFATNIDKALQYAGNTGFTREHGTVGYIFDMKTELGKENVDYQWVDAGGKIKSSTMVSAEWCIREPKKQLKIMKAYEVELCSKDDMKMFLNEAESFKSFSQFNAERSTKKSNYKVYTFMDYQVITPGGKTIRSKEIKSDTFGRKIRVESFGRKTVIYIPASQPSSIDFGRCNMLYGSELEEYLRLLDNFK